MRCDQQKQNANACHLRFVAGRQSWAFSFRSKISLANSRAPSADTHREAASHDLIVDAGCGICATRVLKIAEAVLFRLGSLETHYCQLACASTRGLSLPFA